MKFKHILCLMLGLLLAGPVPVGAAVKAVKTTAQSAQAATQDNVVTAREATDGDTLVLEGGRRVRLIGIDTPELKDEYGRNARTAQRTRASKKMVEHLAIEARTAASKWVEGQKLKLIYDSSNLETQNLDDYGRTLAYVCRESDDSCLAEYMLEEGYALVYRRFNFKRKNKFIKLEDRARIVRRGLWKNQPPAKETKNKK